MVAFLTLNKALLGDNLIIKKKILLLKKHTHNNKSMFARQYAPSGILGPTISG